jgi:gliding motility-associated lipoprotein GldK
LLLANFKPNRGDYYAADDALYTVEAKSYEANGYNLYNMAGMLLNGLTHRRSNAYEYVSSMNPNVQDYKNQRKVVRGGSWKDVTFLQVSTRDHEYADSARSYIGFRTVQDYMGLQTTGNGKRKIINK